MFDAMASCLLHSQRYSLVADGRKGDTQLPASLTLVAGDNLAELTIEGHGLLAQQALVTRKARLGFVFGKIKMLHLQLTRACYRVA
jgi:hypothetical protein